MAKNWIFIFILMALISCGDKPKEIPEEEFRDIIAELVLTDSYVNNVMRPNSRQRDTIDYFNPILEKYGYTFEDVDYTIDKYVRRKTDVIWNTLDQAASRVDVIREIYESDSKMRQKWNAFVEERSIDTIYFNKDTMRIKTSADINKLTRRLPIYKRGKYTVSFSYKMMSGEQNDSHYLVYYLSDTINKYKTPTRNSYWIASSTESEDKRDMNRVISVTNLMKYNLIKIYPFDYNNHYGAREGAKAMDTKIWNFLIAFTPDPRDASNDVLFEDHPYPFIVDIKRLYQEKEDRTFLTPYSLKTLGIKIDSVAIDSL
ncbi:MAG: DUF4296 domain-containing protein [Rikenellaceae bacterium]